MNKTRLILFLGLIFMFLNFKGLAQIIVVNEIMSSNSSVIADAEGDYSDWIELYNNSNDSVNLLGYALSDDRDNYNKFILPNISIEAHGYLLIFASGKDILNEDELHANFKIKQSGEPIILTDNQGSVLSLIESIDIPTDKSYACITDGNIVMDIADTPTPNFSNDSFARVTISHSSGFYTEAFDLLLEVTNDNQQVYYTLNGSVPTINSQLYTGPILIGNNQQSPLTISLIPTTPLSGESQLYDFIWKTPQSVYQCNTLRFAAFENDSIKTDVYTKSYFVDNNIKSKYSFPVVSIVSDSFNLFDYNTGIYIPGKTFDEDGFNWFPAGNYHNRGDEWERDMHISYFEKNGDLGFEADAGMRMRGYGSASNPQKSFTAYFRKEYGKSKIEYPVFEKESNETIKRLIFRNSGNDFLYSHFKDAMLQELIASMDLDLQDFIPAVVFINGEYWGIHNIREKYDKFYFKYKFGISESDINILGICGSVEEGDNSDYKELISYINENDLAEDEHYEYVEKHIDISNFIDFQIAEIYFANYDWPCNNFKIWKDNSADSKWRFLIYDLDYSFGYDNNATFNTQSMEHATSTASDWPYCECSNVIFRNLLHSEEFKNKFTDRFFYCIKNKFDPSVINETIDDFKLMYSAEMGEHINRWNYPSDMAQWEQEIEKLREFANARPAVMVDNINSYFNLASELENKEKVLSLFPNPNKGTFAITNKDSNTIEYGRLMVLNSYGQLVYSEFDIFLSYDEKHNLNLENLSKGMYLLLFQGNNANYKMQFVID